MRLRTPFRLLGVMPRLAACGALIGVLLLLAPHASPQVRGSSGVQAVLISGRLAGFHSSDFREFHSELKQFYSGRGYQPAWIQNSRPTRRALEIIELFADADSEGLNPDDYDISLWPSRIAALNAAHEKSSESQFDVALTLTLMCYIADVRLGTPHSDRVLSALTLGTAELSLSDFVRLVQYGPESPQNLIAEAEPPSREYKAIKTALQKYEEMANQEDPPQLSPPVGVVYRGGYYDHMPELALRLRELGDLPGTAVMFKDMTIYDGPLREAVRHFQARHGLPETGDLTSDTVNELNVPLQIRVRQLRLALARYRSPQVHFTGPHVIVNLPEFRLRMYDASGAVVSSMAVDVGDDVAEFQTPLLQDSIRSVVFRPYWYVTRSILRNEVIPDLAADPEFLRDNDFEVISPSGQVVASQSVSRITLRELAQGRLRLRQRPGPNNSLGLLKVIFPNKYHVYLHDTPERRDRWFTDELSSRYQSHGCIHVERPAELARWLLSNQPKWTMERIETAMQNGPDNQVVQLVKPVPILIEYETARVLPNGEVQFFPDIYRFDASIENAIARKSESSKSNSRRMEVAGNN